MLPSCSARCCSLRHHASSIRANTATARALSSCEQVVDPDRAAGFVERAPTATCASRMQPQPPRRARRRSASIQAYCCSSRFRASSIRANTTTARAPSSRERVADPDRAAGFAERAPAFVRASRVWPQPPRRMRRCSPRAQPAAAPYVTTPAQSEPTRRLRERCRAASKSSILIAPPASPSVRRLPPVPRACDRSCCAERTDTQLRAQPAAAPHVTAPAQ